MLKGVMRLTEDSRDEIRQEVISTNRKEDMTSTVKHLIVPLTVVVALAIAAPASAEEWTGTDSANGHAGTSEPDKFYGRGGNDYLTGRAERDALYGEDGSDTLIGGTWNDRLYGGKGNDTLKDNLDASVDRYYCGPGYDKIYPGANESGVISQIAFDCEEIIYTFTTD